MAKAALHLINLLRGWPHPGLLPKDLLSASSQAVLSKPEVFIPALQYGADPGFQPLREALATWLHSHYSVPRDPERICISGGASQNIACILQSFTDPNVTRAVWLVNPTYHLVFAIFDDAGFKNRLMEFPEDDEGPNLEVLEEKMRQFEEQDEQGEKIPVKEPGPHRKFYHHIIYVVPTCANPSGKTMPVKRREGLVRLARKFDALVICDDVYDQLQWPIDQQDKPTISPHEAPEMILPRLCDIDLAMEPSPNDPKGFGHAVSNGSFSKMVGPGMRTGWLEGSTAFAFGLAQTGSTKSGGSPSQFCASILADMIETGTLQKHLADKVRPNLQHRHRVMVDAIHTHLLPLGFQLREAGQLRGNVYGGYFAWLTTPDGISSGVISEVAMADMLIIGNGTMFQVEDNKHEIDTDKYIRLTFAYVPEDDIMEGVRRLGVVTRKIQENPDKYRCFDKGLSNSSLIDLAK
ncbi:unnamed protein product [Clonostachys rhizophaga]|uniref:Aminotransferase class I/classII large domain-containing protein n=1 Tax=Clonostachys rhizophaga TaxID=160324 RepID=A0A9N9VXJ0_9HYPO|nr:unnamed protein product [Clonostachys rhizophaga]